MKKTGIVFDLVTLLLLAAAMLLRKLELLTVLDEKGLTVFRPVTAVLIALCVLAAVLFFLFSRQDGQPEEQGKAGRIFDLGWGTAAFLVQLWGAWLLYKGWKSGGTMLDLVLALLAGLAAAGWLCVRIAEYREKGSAGAVFLAGALVTLFYCLWLIAYYRDEAPEPSLILTLYAFLALCASCVAAYYYTGRTIGKRRPRRTLVFCGLAALLSMAAQVRGEETSAYRLFWVAGAMQFWLSAAMVLRSPGAAEEAPAEEPEGEENAEAPEENSSEAPEETAEAPEPLSDEDAPAGPAEEE